MNSILGMAGLGSIGIFWSQFVSLFSRIRALVIVKAVFPDRYDGMAVVKYCKNNFRELDIGDQHYSWSNVFVRSLDRNGYVPYERQGEVNIFLRGWRPLIISMKKNSNGEFSNGTQVSFIRGTFSTKDLFVNATIAHDKFCHETSKNAGRRFSFQKFFGRQSSYEQQGQNANPYAKEEKAPTESLGSNRLFDKPLHYAEDDIGPRIEHKPFKRLAYSQNVLEFEREIRRWHKSEKWFKDKGLPWRFGGLMMGPPGTGKSSYARAIGQDLDMPIHSYDLTGMSNEEFTGFWQQSLNAAPCIVLLEDIDRIFDKDKNIQKMEGKAPLTMDCLLNCIGGVQTADGILVLVTANDVTKLDTALGIPDPNDPEGKSTRPGRLDRCVYFGSLEQAGLERIANRILDGYPDLINRVLKEGVGETGAQFESRCSKLALERYWNDQTAGIN